ncbi:PASTA domain-containing protein [Streptomyces sp. NPDC059982]|uniref:PASTA domain-containing protein n=1 Tax=unclassified Streptomyces TaxID=2593676 RepID=UPI0036AFA551
MSWLGPSTADEVTVPDVVGLIVTEARKVAWEAGVVIAASDPDGPPVGALTWPGVWVVTAQSPAPGSRMRRLGSLVIEFREVQVPDGTPPAP